MTYVVCKVSCHNALAGGRGASSGRGGLFMPLKAQLVFLKLLRDPLMNLSRHDLLEVCVSNMISNLVEG